MTFDHPNQLMIVQQLSVHSYSNRTCSLIFLVTIRFQITFLWFREHCFCTYILPNIKGIFGIVFFIMVFNTSKG
jgi:hypothetical protein